MATAAVPGIACSLAGGDAIPIILVSAGAFLHHAWGFSLNEIMDLDVDRKVKELSDKPLVSGRVGKGQAILFSTVCLVLSFLSFLGASLMHGTDLLLPMGLLALSTVAGGSYDLRGKTFFAPSDLLVALWMFFLVCASASVAGEGAIGPSVWAVAGLASLHILFNNSVEGGLKDVENDRGCNVKTLAVVTGCSNTNGKLRVTIPFFIWAVLLRTAFVAMASVFAYLISDDAGWGDWYTIMISLAGFFLFADALNFLRGGKKDRKSLLRSFSVHEMGSFGLSLLVVLPAAGPWAVLAAFVVPAAWFVVANRVMFGSGMAPRV